jgi:pimeloyl-ACP methyl ester carboxylesterase
VAASVDPADGKRSEAVQYLRCGGQRIFSVHHTAIEPARDVAVLLCPPFGWEEVCSHRIVREWSLRLACAGHASLRWTLPGFGDSTGTPHDDDLLDTWTEAAGTAARWLRDAAGVRSVVAIGLGLGGMLAYRAAAAGAPIDGFVLWGVMARGRDVVRQMRAFSKLESSEFFIGLQAPPPLADGALEAGGFLLTPTTVESLRGADLSACPAPPAPVGALVLERDGVAADARLLTALADAAIDTTTARGDGYAEMTSHPQRSFIPEAVFATAAEWLEARSAPGPVTVGAVPSCEPEITLPEAPGATETPFELETRDGSLRGVMTRRGAGSAPLCAVFLNAGAQRRIGPNRMWVEAARRWASKGVASLRLDMLGIGESDGVATPYTRDMTLYAPEFPRRVTSVLDELERQGVAERFLLIGLCAGAYWALHAGLDDDRVAGITMINPVAVIWDDDIGGSRDLRRVFTDRSWRLIRKNATPQRLRGVARMLAREPLKILQTLRSRAGGPPPLEKQVSANLKRWEDPSTRIAAMFAQREGLVMDLGRSGSLARLESSPNVTIRHLPVNDHTLRPVAIQRLVHRELDEELARVLAHVDAGGSALAPAPDAPR